MATHQLAQGLASLGRHGDSMLMHVSPAEVEGLSALGKMTGHKLHTNPHTGMPEAFDFGSFLASLLPTAAGFMMGGPAGAALGIKSGTAAATLAPIAAGMATGAAVAGAKGDDLLTGTLMGGLGGFGGGNLAGTFGKMGATTAANTAANTGAQAGNVASNAASNVGMANQFGATAGVPMGNVASNAASNVGMANQFGATADSSKLLESLGVKPSQVELINSGGGFQSPEALASQSGSNISTGVSQFASDPFGKGYDAFKAAGGSAFDIAAPVGMAGLAGMQPEPYDPSADDAKRKAEENKYRDPRTGLLNLAQASPGLRLATGGTVNTNSSTISSGGIQDLYGTNDQTTGTQNLSKEGYGIGRLNSLAAEGSRAKAADTFYAMGGPIAFADGGIFELEAAKGGYLDGQGDGMSDSIPATIEGKQPARLADGEFVVPADVVSHLGNGSSKAGAKNLYAMMHKVRKARTGHTKQGKEIKPQKYMPA